MSAELKRKAAEVALTHVRPGMRLGLGTGSTAEAFVRLLGPRVAEGLDIVGVPTSERTAALAASLGIRLATLDELPELDLTIDGADEIGPRLALVKGGGGALLRGLDERLRHELGVPVHVATDPLRSVVRGAGRCVEEFASLEQVLVDHGRP